MIGVLIAIATTLLSGEGCKFLDHLQIDEPCYVGPISENHFWVRKKHDFDASSRVVRPRIHQAHIGIIDLDKNKEALLAFKDGLSLIHLDVSLPYRINQPLGQRNVLINIAPGNILIPLDFQRISRSVNHPLSEKAGLNDCYALSLIRGLEINTKDLVNSARAFRGHGGGDDCRSRQHDETAALQCFAGFDDLGLPIKYYGLLHPDARQHAGCKRNQSIKKKLPPFKETAGPLLIVFIAGHVIFILGAFLAAFFWGKALGVVGIIAFVCGFLLAAFALHTVEKRWGK